MRLGRAFGKRTFAPVANGGFYVLERYYFEGFVENQVDCIKKYNLTTSGIGEIQFRFQASSPTAFVPVSTPVLRHQQQLFPEKPPVVHTKSILSDEKLHFFKPF